MRARHPVLAVDDFYSGDEDLCRLAASDPRALYPARIVRGQAFVAKDTEMWSDHPIVLAHPTKFVPEDSVPPVGQQSAPIPRGGPAPGHGLTRAQVVDAVVNNREPDGSWPTQAAAAEALGRDARRLRQVQGKGGWQGILADAERVANT